MTRVPAEAERNIKSAAEEMHDIFHMISVRLLECLTPIMWKMDIMSVGEGPLSKKVPLFESYLPLL
ncbi:hypothetical protein K290105B7_21570 [Anaerostipes caccae]|nr:hypothetical protein ANCC_25890 [Anaerostipes caccae L1-92]